MSTVEVIPAGRVLDSIEEVWSGKKRNGLRLLDAVCVDAFLPVGKGGFPERDMWPGRNPFAKLIKQYRNRFAADEPVKSYFTEAKMDAIQNAIKADGYKAARIANHASFITALLQRYYLT